MRNVIPFFIFYHFSQSFAYYSLCQLLIVLLGLLHLRLQNKVVQVLNKNVFNNIRMLLVFFFSHFSLSLLMIHHDNVQLSNNDYYSLCFMKQSMSHCVVNMFIEVVLSRLLSWLVYCIVYLQIIPSNRVFLYQLNLTYYMIFTIWL